MWLYPRRMRRHIHRLTVSWSTHRVFLRAYRRDTGQFRQDLLYHQAQQEPSARIAVLIHGVNQIEKLMSHCTMSFEAMPVLATRGGLPWPFLAMSRICLESAARLCYVLDDNVGPDQRLMRFAALLAWSNVEARKAASASLRTAGNTVSDFQAHVDAEASQLRKQMYAAGFDVDSGLSVVKDRSGVNRPESASLNLVDTLERQFPGVGEAYYRRSSGFVHGTPWALALAQGWLGADVSSPRLSATVVTDAFLLVGVAVNNAIQLSASYSGIPFRLVTKRLTRILDMTQGELRRLNEPRVRQPHLGPARALSPKWAAMVARAWGHEPASESTVADREDPGSTG